jgi:hypothetical protein
MSTYCTSVHEHHNGPNHMYIVAANLLESVVLQLLVTTTPTHSTMSVIVGETRLSFGIILPGAAIAHCAMGTS